MKKILLVLVGGTICCKVDKTQSRGIDAKAGITIKNNFLNSDSGFVDSVDISITENLNVLSENMTVEKWNEIIRTIREYSQSESYDGMIIAHGTDTLAYSSSLLSIVFNTTKIPIFLVSSNAPLSSAEANGNANFACAVACICTGIRPNVYVTYRNISDGVMYLHLGSRLLQCANYSDDFFSQGAIPIPDESESTLKKCFSEIDNLYPGKERPCAIQRIDELKLADCVLNISPYVGINYDAYDYGKFKAVLHGAYHSGTACVERSKRNPRYGNNSILRLIDLCKDKKVDLYFSPSKSSGERYDSVNYIRDHRGGRKKMRFLYGTTNETAYIKILLAYSAFSRKKDIEAFLDTEYNSSSGEL